MYIRVTTIAYDPAREEEVLQIIDDDLVPSLLQMSGFVSYSGGVNQETARGVAISVWEDMDHAAELRTALGGMIQKFEVVGVKFEPAEIFELSRHISGD